MKHVMLVFLFLSTISIQAQSSHLEITIDLYDAPKKEEVTFNDLIFIESKVFTFDVNQLGQLISGDKGINFQFTKGIYKDLDIELLMRYNNDEKTFLGKLNLSSGTSYFESSKWNKFEFLQKGDNETTYVFNTYDEMKYWITGFITLKTVK